MYKCKYPNLFSPIVLGKQYFKNRIFASPTGYQNINGDGYLNEGAGAYYGRKAQGGVASVATFEGIVDGELGKGGDGHICLDAPSIWRNLGGVAYAIKNHGAVATLELAHTGMYANRELSFFGAQAQGGAYGPVECELDGRTILAMDEQIIERTINKYAQAAALAKRTGFGMILLHAGHGWLLHQFLSPKINTRKDKWGGSSIDNRARLTVAVCEAMRRAVGPDFPIEVRISGSECYDGGYDIDEGIEIAKAIDDYCDLIHVSAGNHEVEEVFAVTHPSMFLPEGANVQYAAQIKKHVKTPVAAIGALSDPQLMEEIIASGQADVVEVARALIADHDFVNKARMGIEPKRCLRCLSCFSDEMTYCQPYCSINPESGREIEMRSDILPSVLKNILVVGGGIGGMQAAITSAQRGHKVMLVEKSNRLGGVLRCEDGVDFKKNLEIYLNHQEAEVKKLGIDVRLNTEVTPQLAKQLAPDVIIAALGAAPIKPNILGVDGKNVMAAQDAYVNLDKVGRTVVIIGAGLVGVELGLHLIQNGRKVMVIEQTDRINDGGNFLHMPGLKAEIKKRGLEIKFDTNVNEITSSGVVCDDGVVDADTVIYATGQNPLREKAEALAFCAPEFEMIGDCISPRNITDATREGFMTARNLGRF